MMPREMEEFKGVCMVGFFFEMRKMMMALMVLRLMLVVMKMNF